MCEGNLNSLTFFVCLLFLFVCYSFNLFSLSLVYLVEDLIIHTGMQIQSNGFVCLQDCVDGKDRLQICNRSK